MSLSHWYYPQAGRFDSGFMTRVKFGSVTLSVVLMDKGRSSVANSAPLAGQTIVRSGMGDLISASNGVCVCVF
jgi:hypothetical protein